MTCADFRALCAELVDEWDSLPWEYDWKGNPVSLGESVDLDFSVVDRARAALAAEPGEGGSAIYLEQVDELCAEHGFHYDGAESLIVLLGFRP
jgi:hypothetical protein